MILLVGKQWFCMENTGWHKLQPCFVANTVYEPRHKDFKSKTLAKWINKKRLMISAILNFFSNEVFSIMKMIKKRHSHRSKENLLSL